MKQPIICITGGHLTPALAVIEEIQRQKHPWNMMFIGRSHAFEGAGAPTQEERLIKAYAIPFHALFTGRQGFSLWKFPIGFFQSFFLLASYRPAAVLSFGGYIALPVTIAAFLLNIPIITHEQTENLGLANRIIARFARRVILARESGVPIRRALFDPPAKPSFSVDTKHPILYITGGSTGAASLNALVFPLITELIKTYTVIHQTGITDFSSARRVKELLGDTRHRYVVASYFDLPDIAWIYRHLTLLIGRAGANTVAESAALGLPALFIPLPWAGGDEQTRNARRLAGEGTAVVLEQQTLTGDTLLTRIGDMMRVIHQFRKSAGRVAKLYPRDGAEKVVQVLQDFEK